MDSMRIEPKEYCAGFSISRDLLDRPGPYGFYTRNGVRRFRNYGRDLKNGKGMTLLRVGLDGVRGIEKVAQGAMNG